MGRFRVGVGLSAPMKSIIYIKLFLFFYKCMQTIKLRRTTENNGGPWTLKTDTKRIEEEDIFLFVTYTIIQNITSSEICVMHLTRVSAHTPEAVGCQ